MRLKPAKIDHLANKIFDALAQNEEIKLVEGRDKFLILIRQIITDDLKAEDEIEEEARRMLDVHIDQIRSKGVSYEQLLLKAKRKLAQESKIVL
jgi:hypothetical protein